MSDYLRELRADLQAEAMNASEQAGVNRVEAQRLEREADALQEYADALLVVAHSLEA